MRRYIFVAVAVALALGLTADGALSQFGGGFRRTGITEGKDPVTWTGDHVFDGLMDFGTAETFTDSDTTPDVSTGVLFNTNTTGVTITDFDGSPADGQLLIVRSAGAIVYDCTGAGLDCGSADITTASGDVTVWVFEGTDWDLVSFMDVSTDIGLVATGDITDVYNCASGDCADIAVGATDRLDFSGNDSSTTTEGLVLPQHATVCAGGTAEGQVCWEADQNALFIGDGSALLRVSPGGVQTLWLSADQWTPTVTNGANAYASAETTALRPDVNHLGFATAADDHAQASIGFSTAWDLGTITFQVYWAHAAATTFGVTWVLQCVSVTNDGTIDVAFGTAVTVDDAGGTTEDLFVTAESAAVTCAGTPADGELTYFQLFRDVSDVNDDLDVNADMIGIKIFFTTDTAI